MSLLDDVSIVVTPNGYKAGELYAVVPVPTEGSELVTNGDFSDGLTGWVGNPETTLSVSNNELDIQSSSASGQYGAAFSEVNFELGKQYIVQLTVVSCNVPNHIRVGGSTTATSYSQNIWASGDRKSVV